MGLNHKDFPINVHFYGNVRGIPADIFAACRSRCFFISATDPVTEDRKENPRAVVKTRLVAAVRVSHHLRAVKHFVHECSSPAASRDQGVSDTLATVWCVVLARHTQTTQNQHEKCYRSSTAVPVAP